MTIRAAFFDLGNVLIDFDHRLAARRIAPHTSLGPQEIYDLFFDSELTGSFEQGVISAQEFYAQLSRLLSLRISFEEFLPIWNEIFFLTAANLEAASIARSLRPAYRVCVLSNVNQLHYDYLKSHFPVFEGFDRIFTSCELKARKPDAEIYRRSAAELGVRLEECFYTDDRPELIAAARALGMHACIYRDPGQLRRDCAVHQLTPVSKNP